MRKMSVLHSKTLSILAMTIAGLAFTGCTTTLPKDDASAAQQKAEINTGTSAALDRLYQAAPESRELVANAKGVLVFPKVLSASFVVGGEHGNGVLRTNGNNDGYYSLSGGSIGFQAGVQSKAVVMLFMTQEALDNFRASNGWTAGVDATVAVANIGANGSIDTNTAGEEVIGFVMTNAGLVAGVSLEGSKIQKISEAPSK